MVSALDILKQYWGYDSFRGIQQEIIESILSGRDTLGLMPTGGGKSVTFQVPALMKEGVCLVVTPLIALMKDQVQQLRKRGIQAEAVFAGMAHTDVLRIFDNAVLGGVKILYLSPERLSSELFLAKLMRMKVSFITVDEAHCICQWGYDFRPHYLEIGKLRELKPDAPVLALTATATPRVVKDIQYQLRFKQENVFSMSFARSNLVYMVRHTEDKRRELIHILNSVVGSAVVYVRSRRYSKELSELLNEEGICATYYHAGLERAVKDKRQEEWTNEKVRVMVATNAFGMGIDKDNVRLVIHFQAPGSIEAYFQEAGRAGRDGKKAFAVLLYAESDTYRLNRRINDTFPDRNLIRQIYGHLASYYQIAEGEAWNKTFLFDIDRFSIVFRHFPLQVHSALKILESAGYISYVEDSSTRSRVKILLNKSELSRIDMLSPKEENTLTALLRNYGGLFSDYVYIDEGLIMDAAGVTREQVYLLLKGLSERKVIHYIPQQTAPTITYRTERLDPDNLVISHQVFEERKQELEQRIKAMIHYATCDTECRSKQLLAYFGESSSEPCGLCDVCLQKKNTGNEDIASGSEAARILDYLKDGKIHSVNEVRMIIKNTDKFNATIKALLLEEKILLTKNGISLYT